MKALVIGSTGIIGNHIIRTLLKEGIEVRAFSRGVTPSINLEGLDVERVKGDILDSSSIRNAVKGCGWVFHAASYFPTTQFGTSSHIAVAMKGINSVLNAVSYYSLDRFVYTSSLTTIGKPHYFGELANESCEYDLIKKSPHPYFIVKFLMEEEVRKKAEAGFPAVIVNPTGCFGPYEFKPAHIALIPKLLKREIPFCMDAPINVVDVADVGRGHFLAAEKGQIGHRYILGGHNVTSKWVIEKICELASVAPPRIKVPLRIALMTAWVSEFLAHFVFKKPPFLPTLPLRYLQYGQYFDISKAQNELGYTVSPMEDCFVRAIEWFKKIKGLG